MTLAGVAPALPVRTLDASIAIPWTLLFAALAALWLRDRRAAAWLFAAGIAAAFATGGADAHALAPMAALAGAAWAIAPERPRGVRIAGHAAWIALAVALRRHLAPGFHNPRLFDGALDPSMLPFQLYLNLDAVLLVPFVVWGWARAELGAPARAVRVGAVAALGTAATVFPIALAAGVIAWSPKWPPIAPVWAANNLLLVALVEEAFFRGYLQDALQRAWGARGRDAALAVSALLFGLAHLAGGATYAALAVVAGLGYGLAYRFGGLRGAWLCHGLFNLAHFALFSYPMRAP